jgi:hypothetical protein
MTATYGVMAEFSRPEQLATALARARAMGYTRIETFMPYPVEGVARLPSGRRSPVALSMLVGGLLSGLGAFWLQYYAAHDYPLDVGGRPLNSWPAFVPITFELTVLGAALTGVVTFFIMAGYPRLEHPVFNDERFHRASQDRFFLCVRSDDPLLASASLERLRAAWGADSIAEVTS